MIEALAIILAVVTIAGAVAIVIYAGKLSKAQNDARIWHDKFFDTEAAFQRLSKEMLSQTTRLEAVIKTYKEEIQRLEGELDEVADPSVVRSRLKRLFTDPGSSNT